MLKWKDVDVVRGLIVTTSGRLYCHDATASDLIACLKANPEAEAEVWEQLSMPPLALRAYGDMKARAERAEQALAAVTAERDEAKYWLAAHKAASEALVDPVTGHGFFMLIGKGDDGVDGWFYTFGGPFDSYTLCERSDDEDPHFVYFHRERYDHDQGGWADDVEVVEPVLAPDECSVAPYCLEDVTAERDTLKRERDEARSRLRSTCQVLVEATGADGPLTAEEAAKLAVGQIDGLKRRVSDLKFALGDNAGWFDRFKKAERERDEARAKLAEVEQGYRLRGYSHDFSPGAYKREAEALRSHLAKTERVVDAARAAHRILARDRARTGWGSNDLIYAMCQTAVALRALDAHDAGTDSGGASGAATPEGGHAAPTGGPMPPPEPAGSSCCPGCACGVCLSRFLEPVPPEVHERGWQWRPVGDGAFAPPFGTVRACVGCGCLVAGGPTACARCAQDSPVGVAATAEAKPDPLRTLDPAALAEALKRPFDLCPRCHGMRTIGDGYMVGGLRLEGQVGGGVYEHRSPCPECSAPEASVEHHKPAESPSNPEKQEGPSITPETDRQDGSTGAVATRCKAHETRGKWVHFCNWTDGHEGEHSFAPLPLRYTPVTPPDAAPDPQAPATRREVEELKRRVERLEATTQGEKHDRDSTSQ